VVAFPDPAHAQESRPEDGQADATRTEAALQFLAGAATGLAAHESGHLAFDYLFNAHPGVERVEFVGIPFFAITHDPVSRRRELVISSAGFWIQNGLNEVILTRRPRLREQRGAFVKGLLAFNVLASVAYAGAAFAGAGPAERDTRGMAINLGPTGVEERWIGVLVLTPAVLDGYRYFVPASRWARWVSRAVKIGMIVMILA
jgi:hypothetical protein